MSNSKKLLQSASGYIDQTSGGTDVKNVFNMMQWTGNGQSSKTFGDNYYTGFNIYGNLGTSNPTSGAMILKDTKIQSSGEIYYNSSPGFGTTKSLILDTSTSGQRSEHSNESGNATTPPTYVNFTTRGYSTSNYFRNATNGQVQSYFFKKHPKFFTIVNYTGNGQSSQQIAHDLGGEIGMMWVKHRHGGQQPICVYHRGINDNATHSPARNAHDYYWQMDDNGARTDSTYWNGTDTAPHWGNTAPTDTHFTVGGNGSGSNGGNHINVNNAEYVALIWGHDDSDTSIIKNIGYLGVSGDNKITLGFTPQFLLIKRVDGGGDWIVLDRLQGMMNQDTASGYGSVGNYYWALNKNGIQQSTGTKFRPEIHADGFTFKSVDNHTNNGYYSNSYIIMAIAKDNTSPDKSYNGTTGAVHISDLGKRQQYFKATTRTGTNTSHELYIDMIPDTWMTKRRPTGDYWIYRDRASYPGMRANLMNAPSNNYVRPNLFGWGSWHYFNSNVANYSYATSGSRVSRSVSMRSGHTAWNGYNHGYLDLFFAHAPGFLNSIMYRGTGVGDQTIKHGLKAVPEMVWVMPLDNNGYPIVWHKDMAQGISGGSAYQYFFTFDRNNYPLRTYQNGGIWSSTAPTDTTFTVNGNYNLNSQGSPVNYANSRFVMLTFASCPGLSSVGSFTMSNGNPTTVDCGFGSNQPRFVMVKCVGNFESGKPNVGQGMYVWDYARGINGSGSTDPIFQFDNPNHNENSDTADIIDPTSGGLTVKDSGAVNTGIYDGFYIYWAIC